MRTILLTGFALSLLACGNPAPFACEDEFDCNLRPLGLCVMSPTMQPTCAYPEPACVPSGYAYDDGGGPLSGVCIGGGQPGEPDAMVPMPDANVDAANLDATEPDQPIIDQSPDAIAVIGQRDFVSGSRNGGSSTPTAEFVSSPGSVFASATDVWVGDVGNQRILGWSPEPPTGSVAGRVLGRTDFTSYGLPRTEEANASRVNHPRHVFASGGKLLMVDYVWSRVLVWNSPTANGQAADLVLGQSTMTTVAPGVGSSRLSSPRAAWTDGTRLAIADGGNHRVLLWTQFPAANGTPATVVLGQPNFDSGTQPAAPTATNMSMPTSVWSDGTRLFVVDSQHSRVLAWNTWPTRNGQAADYVIGQPNLTATGAGVGTQRLELPDSVITVDDALFVADTRNNRVLVFQPIPTADFPAATRVIGQPDFVSDVRLMPPTAGSMISPSGLGAFGNRLYVADGGNHRVLVYQIRRRGL